MYDEQLASSCTGVAKRITKAKKEQYMNTSRAHSFEFQRSIPAGSFRVKIL
jgi:hypothetical protein